MKGKFTALHPEYYRDFTCIGGECEENCCRGGWNIFVDRKSYQKLRSIRDPEFAKEISTCTKRIRGENANKAYYATLLLDETGSCRFLTDDGFCGIQKKHGAGYLCHTCRVYPRQHSLGIEGGSEFSLSMSCPEAVRIALFSKEPMQFQVSELALDTQDSLLAMPSFAVRPDAKTQAFVPHLWKIREACIDILQYRGTALNNRLFAIGMMLDKLEKAGGEGVPETVSIYTGAVLAGQFDGVLSTFRADDDMRGNMEAILFTSVILFARTSRSFRQLSDRFFSMAAETEDGGDAIQTRTLFDFVNTCVEKHWEPFLGQYSHVLENYFVNYIFSAVFPFSFQADLTLYEHFIVLAEQYALLQILLCSLAGDDGVTEEHLVRTVSAFSRFSQHSQDPARVVDLYKGNHLESLAHMSFLLRK